MKFKDIILLLMKKLSSLFYSGKYGTVWSALRFAFLFTVILSNVVILSVWTYLCFATKSVLDIPSGVIWIYGLANGISFTGKGAQKTIEEKSEDSETDTSVKQSLQSEEIA